LVEKLWDIFIWNGTTESNIFGRVSFHPIPFRTIASNIELKVRSELPGTLKQIVVSFFRS